MRPPSKAMVLCLAVSMSLACAASRDARAASLTGDSIPSMPCEQNPNITPSLRICAFQRDDVRYYRIDTTGGRHVRLAVVNGDVEVLPVGHETVRIALSNTATPSSGMETMVYRDATLEIDAALNPQNQLTWVVRPIARPASRTSKDMCTGADCSGGHFRDMTVPSQDMCTGSDCSGNGILTKGGMVGSNIQH